MVLNILALVCLITVHIDRLSGRPPKTNNVAIYFNSISKLGHRQCTHPGFLFYSVSMGEVPMFSFGLAVTPVLSASVAVLLTSAGASSSAVLSTSAGAFSSAVLFSSPTSSDRLVDE